MPGAGPVADVEGLEYLGARECMVAGVPALVLRIGFPGEPGYEIHLPSDAAEHVWDAIMAAGRPRRSLA